VTKPNSNADLTVIILTYNEEKNIAQALESVCGWAREVFVLDSFSSDRTLEIAENHETRFVQNRFEGFVEQRNYALDHLPISTKWVFFLDADEWLTDDLKQEIGGIIRHDSDESGFYVKRRFIWMGKWVRHGYYPVWLLRMMRLGKGRWEARSVNEHLVVEGKVGYLNNDIIHEDHRSVSEWIVKHNVYAEFEATELARHNRQDRQLPARVFGTQAERKRWLRERVWNHLPPLLRPLLYFTYRFLIRGGFLDGTRAFSYHVLQALWYPMLIDLKYLELRPGTLTDAPVASARSGIAGGQQANGISENGWESRIGEPQTRAMSRQ
jgi:glycosyltransferase involved in cell wall biosynthesis